MKETEFIAEVLNTDGNQVDSGEEGELVLTNLGRWGFPAIRYKTGDMVRYSAPTESTCNILYLSGGIIGRVDDMVTVRGVNIYPGAIDNLVWSIDEVEEYRTIVTTRGKMGEMNIEIEVRADADQDLAKSILAQLVTDKLGLRPNIKIVAHDVLPRFEMKGKRFFVN